MKRYILALDEGTTSARSLLYNIKDRCVEAVCGRPVRQFYPEAGWVEEDANEIFETQLATVNDAVGRADIPMSSVACIGIANQRETVVAWDSISGEPLYNAIVWQCRRTADLCEKLKADGRAGMIYDKTGLVIDAYFSGTKIKWLIDNVPAVREGIAAHRVMFGTVDSWLIYKLTGGRLHVTDFTNASRTMLFNIHTLEWDRELLEMLGIPGNTLPSVVLSSGLVGYTDESVTGARIPVCGIAGDQQAALFGQACFEAGHAKNTYGTGCFILMNTGKTPVKSKNNLLTTIAWGMDEGMTYALEGSIFNAGSTLQWLRDGLGLISETSEADRVSALTPDTNGVYVVPAFTGLGAPYWDMYARGIITGLTRGTTKNHLIRAALESIAYQSADVFEAMTDDSGIALSEIRVDGGASASDVLMGFQAGLLGVRVLRPETLETTAMGACFLAGLGAGIFQNKDEVGSLWRLEREFVPSMPSKQRETLIGGWKRAVERAKGK